jgi:hypothetical protein
MMAVCTKAACVTWHVVRGCHAISDFACCSLPKGNYAPDDLVTQDDRRPRPPIPLHDVAPTDTAALNLYKGLTWTNLRDRPVLNSDISVAVIDCGAHGWRESAYPDRFASWKTCTASSGEAPS